LLLVNTKETSKALFNLENKNLELILKIKVEQEFLFIPLNALNSFSNTKFELDLNYVNKVRETWNVERLRVFK
jgi:hypothetical protein